MCQNYSCLPQAGGLLDQDHLWIWFMYKVAEFDAVRQKLDDAKAKAGHQ